VAASGDLACSGGEGDASRHEEDQMSDITVRRVKFEFPDTPDTLDDVFPGIDPVRESYLVAFSLTMPALEPYLIRTYRSVADKISDPVLAADVREFIGQEAQSTT
jgi:uncharacterized protein